MRATIVLVLAAVACAICAAPALGDVKISGSDDDVWNAATTPTYTITGSPDAEIDGPSSTATEIRSRPT